MKMPQTVAGIALLFEIINGGREAVGLEATEQAVEWAEYLETHAQRIYSISTDGAMVGAKSILKRRKKLPTSFTARELRRKGWTGLVTPDDVKEAIDCLVDHYYLSEINLTHTLTGGRPTIKYTWNPELDREY